MRVGLGKEPLEMKKKRKSLKRKRRNVGSTVAVFAVPFLVVLAACGVAKVSRTNGVQEAGKCAPASKSSAWGSGKASTIIEVAGFVIKEVLPIVTSTTSTKFPDKPFHVLPVCVTDPSELSEWKAWDSGSISIVSDSIGILYSLDVRITADYGGKYAGKGSYLRNIRVSPKASAAPVFKMHAQVFNATADYSAATDEVILGIQVKIEYGANTSLASTSSETKTIFITSRNGEVPSVRVN